jgi:hypothetical protein
MGETGKTRGRREPRGVKRVGLACRCEGSWIIGKGKKGARNGTRSRVADVVSTGLLYDGKPRFVVSPNQRVRLGCR